MNDIKRYQKNTFFILFFLFSVLLVFLTHLFSTFLIPLFFAFFTAMFLHPFIEKLYKYKIPYWLSILIVYLLFILLIGFLLTILIVSITKFIEDIPSITHDIRINILTFITDFSEIEIIKKFVYNEEVNKALMKMVSDTLSIDNLRLYIIKPFAITINLMKSFGLYIVFLIFIIPGMDKLTGKILKAFPNKKGKKINILITDIMKQIQNYIFTKSLISLITAISSLFVCLIFGIKYALLWGTIFFLFNFIPYIGSTIAILFPVLLSIIQYQSPVTTMLLSIILISIQIALGNIIEPKFLGDRVNLSPLIVIISLLIFGYIWGISGVILAVPTMSAINLICKNIDSLKPLSVFMDAKAEKSI